MTALCWAVAGYVINPHATSVFVSGVNVMVNVSPRSQLTLLAQLSSVARQTDAGERIGSIQTGAAVQTWVGLAFIHLCGNRTAVIPRHPEVSRRTAVLVHWCTCFAVLPIVPRCAHTDVLGSVFVAGTSVLTHAG